MELGRKTKIIIGLVVAFGLVAAGRWSVNQSFHSVSTTETSKDKNTETEKNKTTETEIVEEKTPDGKVTTTTRIVENSTEKKNTEVKSTNKTTDSVEKVRANDRLTLSAMVGADPFNLSKGLQLGVSLTKPIFGPVVLGAWALPSSSLYGFHIGFQY